MDNFAIFILTHGRPDRQHTLKQLLGCGWTGRTYLVIDDEDKTAARYRELYGDAVLTFSKAEVAAQTDEGDNSGDRRVILYARNACFDLARKVGVRYFLQFDDDYTNFGYRYDKSLVYRFTNPRTTLTDAIGVMLDYFKSAPFTSLAMSQGGDHIGGGRGVDSIRMRRKAMNSFLCDTERPFRFVGRLNEDVNTYTSLGARGALFGTIMQFYINQVVTQAGAGGMTDVYASNGTYYKSFYSVMYAPSCCRIATIASPTEDHDGYPRIHHLIDWERAAPKIVSERVRKPRTATALSGGMAAIGDGPAERPPGAENGTVGEGTRSRRRGDRRAVTGGA